MPHSTTGGHVANTGVQGQPVTLHLDELWSKDITLTTRLVDTFTIPTLLDLIEPEQIDAPCGRSRPTASHSATRVAAYDTFARAAEAKALKVLMTR